MIEDILIPLVAIGLAEMGDKTQLSILLLSSRTDRYLQLLLGVMLAFFIVDGAAILLGSWITTVVPENVLRIFSAAIFIIFGILILRGEAEKAEEKMGSRGPFASGFSLIFISEWGDKTQIASALFATEYNPWMVLVGTMAALAILSVLAIYLGKFISSRIDRKLITRAAGIVFMLIGMSFALSAVDLSAFADFI